ncbi:putative glycoside hydrolase [Sulfurimonas sp.]|nr:putative glycoside hydrolase [Sulfurimonas sp.]
MKYLALIIFTCSTILHASYSATIFDEDTLNPIFEATISDSSQSVKSKDDGSFHINSQSKILHVKACGYKSVKIRTNEVIKDIKLTPFTIKAVYLSFWHASNNSPRLKDVLDLIDNSEINSVVVDIKNEWGSLVYKTPLESVERNGGHKNRTNRNIEKLMSTLKDKNIYTIARIVTFKDDIQAQNNQEYAVKDMNGTMWRNSDNMAWVDPFDKRSHEYAVSIAEEAAKIGFDEINFDYIRFPARQELSFSKESNQENRIEAINDFLSLADNRLRKYGVFTSVDVYGNVCWSQDDNNIGQTIESLAQHVDYISPMLYPSSFASGSFSFENPSEYPYEVVYRSIKNLKDRIDPIRVRPWLQHFKDYAHSKKRYKKLEITEQIRATEDTNTSGWMMWSPSSRYYKKYFSKPNE